jgi:F-type H+-transporting ATPase subunit b
MGLGKDLPLWLQLLLQFVNFAILAVVLVRFLKKPLKAYVLKRRQIVKESMDEAGRRLSEAERIKKLYEDKLAGLEKEMEAFCAGIFAAMEQDARGLAARISEQARLAYEQEMKEAMEKVRSEAAMRTIAAAERKVRETFSRQDHERMVEEFIEKVRSLN